MAWDYQVKWDPRGRIAAVTGHEEVIADLFRHDVALLPAVFDLFIAKGVAISRLIDKQRKSFKYSQNDFETRAAGAEVSYRTSVAARQSRVTGIFQAADKSWQSKYGNKLFGSTYIDTSPSSWAEANLAVSLTRSFAVHVQKAL